MRSILVLVVHRVLRRELRAKAVVGLLLLLTAVGVCKWAGAFGRHLLHVIKGYGRVVLTPADVSGCLAKNNLATLKQQLMHPRAAGG